MIKKIRQKLFNLLCLILSRNGFAVVKWKSTVKVENADLPEEARKYLVKDNGKLWDMISRYNRLDENVTNSKVWSWSYGGLGSELLHAFRGDRAYVWQIKGADIPELRYLNTTYYQLANDRLGLLTKFKDDSLFGNHLFEVAGRFVSREVLDSANEINFLERHLNISSVPGLKILDIGAGYGRLAHRCSEALPNLEMYYCTDGIPVSSFICEFYLNFRKVKNARVVEMPDIEQTLAGEKIHLALNIHSFSECSLEGINWWMERLARLNIRYLMIVPNAFADAGARLLTNRREDFSDIVKKHSYRLIAKEPKYSDPLMQKLGLYPTFYYLFEKSSV